MQQKVPKRMRIYVGSCLLSAGVLATLHAIGIGSNLERPILNGISNRLNSGPSRCVEVNKVRLRIGSRSRFVPLGSRQKTVIRGKQYRETTYLAK